MSPDDPRHGTTNGYSNLKCRCQPCRDAWSRWTTRYRARLLARGWTWGRNAQLQPLDTERGAELAE